MEEITKAEPRTNVWGTFFVCCVYGVKQLKDYFVFNRKNNIQVWKIIQRITTDFYFFYAFELFEELVEEY